MQAKEHTCMTRTYVFYFCKDTCTFPSIVLFMVCNSGAKTIPEHSDA